MHSYVRGHEFGSPFSYWATLRPRFRGLNKSLHQYSTTTSNSLLKYGCTCKAKSGE